MPNFNCTMQDEQTFICKITEEPKIIEEPKTIPIQENFINTCHNTRYKTLLGSPCCNVLWPCWLTF